MYKSLIKIVSLFLFLVIGAYLLQTVEPTKEAYIAYIDGNFKSNDFISIFSYLIISAFLVCFAVPRQLISFVGGYAFGAFYGLVYATFATTLGATLIFFYSRMIAQKYVQRKFSHKILKLENFLMKNPMQMTIIIRLLPLGNNLVTNMLAGVTKVNARSFLLGSFIGYIPQNFIFSLLGSGMQLETYTRVMISAILLLIATFLGWQLYQKNKQYVSSIVVEEQEK